MLHRFSLLEPSSAREACQMLHDHGDEARAIAGGTALTILMKQGMVRPSVLINLLALQGLDDVRYDERSGLHLGALATHRAVERAAAATGRFPALAEAYRVIGNIRVRTMGTVGGNLAEADYRLDPPAPLLAYGATIEITGRDGTREVPIEQFFHGLFETALEEGELITGVTVPTPAPGTRSVYLKFSSTAQMDWPCLGVAAAVRLENGRCAGLRVALTAVSSTPVLVAGTDELAVGKELTDDVVAAVAVAAQEQIDPTDDLRGSAWYKREIAAVWTERAIRAALAS